MHIDFALAIYPQRRGNKNSPYECSPVLRQETWGVLKVLLGTTYAHLEEDLNTLAIPVKLDITTYDDIMVRLYECRAMKWSNHYAEVQRMMETTMSLGKTVPHMCVEVLGISNGKTMFFNQYGHHSNLLTTKTSIQVNI